ncbi:MAG: type IV pilus modification protein PilV [Pseudomonadales bacterium]|nr:type IV pilus modification protein PilV [Pseudomonadales bacterium]
MQPVKQKMSIKQSGVGMIEVLITIAIIAIGFFTLLVFQMSNLERVSNANQQYAAILLAHDMGERIRANILSAAHYDGINTQKTLNCGGRLANFDACSWKNALVDPSHHFYSLNNGKVAEGALGEVVIADDGRIARVTMYWLERVNRQVSVNRAFREDLRSYELVVPLL